MGRGTAYVGAAIVVLGLAGTRVAVARDDTPPVERLSLEELMGVRVRTPAMSSQPMETAPSMISVLTAEQIHALGLRTLSEALELMPGVTVLQTQFGGKRIVVRGRANPNDVLVTLDGERLNDFYDGSWLTELPLENVERIELIRGPGSALYGTNAFAGVIAIFSKTRREIFGGVGGELYLDHSAGWGVRAHAKAARSFGRWTVELFGSYWETSGPRVLVEADNADPSYSRVGGDTDGRLRLGVGQLSIKREGLLVRGDALELWALYQYRLRGSYFGPNNVFAPGSSLEKQSLHTYLGYSAPLPGNLRLYHRFAFDRRDSDNLIRDEPPGYFHEVDGNFVREPGEVFPDGLQRSFSYVTYRLSETTQLDWALPRPRGIAGNQLSVGVRLEYSWIPEFSYGQNFCCGAAYTYAGPTLRNYDQLPLTQVGKDRLLTALFVQDELHALRTLWITAGLRLDYFSDFGATLNPRAAIVYRPLSELSFKLLYGRAFRAPTFRDLYDQTGVSETAGGLRIAGNPKLRPETTNTVEAGLETSPWRHLTLRADMFYIRSSDVIDVDSTFTVSGAMVVNFPGLQIWGGEAEVQLHLDERNYFSANLSLFTSSQTGEGLPGWESDPERRFVDSSLVDLPRLRLNGMLVTSPFERLGRVPVPIRRLQLGLSYHYVSGVANNNRFTFEALDVFRMPRFHELGANVIVPLLGGRLEVIATVQGAIGRTVAVPLESGWYNLQTNTANLFVGLRAYDGGGR